MRTHLPENEHDDESTVARLACFPPGEYEKVRKLEAERLGWRTKILDAAVIARRQGAGIDSETEAVEALGIKDPELWPRPIACGARLLDAIFAALRQYVVADRNYLIAATLWVVFTFLIDEPGIEVSPRLAILSPEMRCGKTRLVEILSALAYRPIISSNISPSVIFRLFNITALSLFIDEADTLIKKGKDDGATNEDLRGIINSGHSRKTAYAYRNVPTATPGAWIPQKFSTWGAMAIAAIGSLPSTWLDRSILIRLRRKLRSDRVSKLRQNDDAAHTKLATLRRKIQRWTSDNAATIAAARAEIPVEIESDRVADNWATLLAIADIAGGVWPTLARVAAVQIETVRDENSIRVLLLGDIRTIFKDAGEPRYIGSSDLCVKLHQLQDRPWGESKRPLTTNRLAFLLREFGIGTINQRDADGKVVKAYQRTAFDDAFVRYLPTKKPSPSKPGKKARAH